MFPDWPDRRDMHFPRFRFGVPLDTLLACCSEGKAPLSKFSGKTAESLEGTVRLPVRVVSWELHLVATNHSRDRFAFCGKNGMEWEGWPSENG